nr:hypothetical protein [Tanacetum cinerariifolium]
MREANLTNYVPTPSPRVKGDGSNMREGTATRVNLEESSATCDESPKVSHVDDSIIVDACVAENLNVDESTMPSDPIANIVYGFFLGMNVAYPVVANYKPSRCSSCKVFGHILEERPKNTCVGEKKTVKKPSQSFRGVPVGPKMDFKPQKEYRPVFKKFIASSSGNKKKCVEPTSEVSNSNPFFASNTPIGEKFVKIELQIGEGKLRLLDNDENPLVSTGIVKSDSEVKVVFDDTANLMISMSGKDGSDKGYGTNSLLEQWRDSYPDNDDYDPYDDDMYENHDLSEHL